MRGVPSVLLVLTLLMSGCLVDAPELEGDAPDLPTPSVQPPAASGPGPVDRPALEVRLEDLRQRPFDGPAVQALVQIQTPGPARDLQVQWILDDEAAPTGVHTIEANTTNASIARDLPFGPGLHAVAVAVGWPDERPVTARLDYLVHAPVRLVLNASEKYASDQNVFHTDHVVPFLPDEDALVILRRAADTYGFPLKTTYRQDLDSHFVDAINGTAFRWEVEAAAISRNWMVLLDDEPVHYAVDDLVPEPEQTLEFRYVRCYSTGNCDDL